jgi:hypothetical protein
MAFAAREMNPIIHPEARSLLDFVSYIADRLARPWDNRHPASKEQKGKPDKPAKRTRKPLEAYRPEEQAIIRWLERDQGREFTKQEVHLGLEQARHIGARFQGSTHEATFVPAGVIQTHDVLPVEYSSPMKCPWSGSAALEGSSPS